MPKPTVPPVVPGPQFGIPVLTITIEQDRLGNLRTRFSKQIHALDIMAIFTSCLHGQLEWLKGQSRMMIQPGMKPDSVPIETPSHNFVACFDNPEICSYCGSHKGNHDQQEQTEENDNRRGGVTSVS